MQSVRCSRLQESAYTEKGLKGMMKRLSKNTVISAVLILIVIYSNFIALQAGCHVARRILVTKPLYLCYNLLFLCAFYCIIQAFSSRLYLSTMIFSTLCTVWALINDYVYALHGQIFTLAELGNAGTALNVISNFPFMKRVPLIFGSVILLIYVFNVIISQIQKRTDSGRKRLSAALPVFFGTCIFVALSFPARGMQEIILKDWTARNTCIEEGYPMYVYASVFMNSAKVIQPEGYDEGKIADYERYTDSIDGENTPDVILILNEAFYDLSLLMELETDIPYLENYSHLDNAVRGYTATSVIGGATNRSEFELLTGNSNYLLGELTPFNVLDMSYTSSIVTNLKECGYYTLAAHPADGGNYNRISSYSAMGFDERYFKEDFQNFEHYGKREWMTDQSAYRNLTDWYEAAKKDHEKVFAYLLTMQNHSDYDSNSEQDALVHVQNYTGNMEQELNEYLSCVYLSDLAFKELTDYFSKQEQPVIVCMTGDHAPNMIRELADVDSSPEREVLARSTPFILWANYEIDSRDMGIIGVNSLVPLLLEEAGIKRIPYYCYIREMQKSIPMVGSFGMVMDGDGEIHSYYDDGAHSDLIWKYMYLTYNNLQKESIEGWFHLPES